MQPRTLASILSELDSSGYSNQVNTLKKKQSEIPNAVRIEEGALDAKKDQAYGDILNGARRRGTGVAFGGIPLGEQAKYAATEYMPALARLKQSGREQALSLEDAINQIYDKRNAFGYQIKQGEDQLFESRRQFDTNLAFQREQALEQSRQAARAAAAASFSPSLGGLGGGQTPASSAGVFQRKDKGFDFKDAYGNPISAAAYAAGAGISFRQLLQTMANQGDAGAKSALGFVGDDFGYNPQKIGNNKALYNSLVWGTNKALGAGAGSGPAFTNSTGKAINLSNYRFGK